MLRNLKRVQIGPSPVKPRELHHRPWRSSLPFAAAGDGRRCHAPRSRHSEGARRPPPPVHRIGRLRRRAPVALPRLRPLRSRRPPRPGGVAAAAAGIGREGRRRRRPRVRDHAPGHRGTEGARSAGAGGAQGRRGGGGAAAEVPRDGVGGRAAGF